MIQQAISNSKWTDVFNDSLSSFHHIFFENYLQLVHSESKTIVHGARRQLPRTKKEHWECAVSKKTGQLPETLQGGLAREARGQNRARPPVL